MSAVGTLRDELLARVDAIAPVLEADIPLGDELRRLPDTTVDALRGADLLRLKVPEALGGYEAEPDLQFEVFERVARTNIAAAWCLFIWADALGAACARLPDAGIGCVLDGADMPVMCGGGGLRPGTLQAVPGGYRLNGRYRYGSGMDASSWVLLLGAGERDGAREVRNCVVARDDIDVEDNWHVLGLRGTGSADYAVHDAFVPEELTYPVGGPPLRGGRMYRTGIVGYLGYPLPAVALGLVRRVLSELIADAGTVTRGYTSAQVLASRPTFQHFLGEADQRLKAARALMLASGAGLMDAVEAAGDEPVDLRPVEAEVRAAGAYAVRVAVDVLGDIMRFGGGGIVRDGSVYERAVRDLTTAANHLLVNESSYENHAQFLLGVPGADPLA